jgi:TolB-like protein/Flp pilus assembly protein TadD
MSAEKDREPISAVPAGAAMPAGAVFLSYASEDAAAAERIAAALRAAGIEVWFDKSELRGGDAWDRQIREQIHDCRLFIPVISANSERRDEGYFRREWSFAADRTRDMAHKRAFLVPVVIDGTPERGASVPDKFHELQWTRLPGGETPPAFAERVKRLLSPDSSPASVHAHAASSVVAGIASAPRGVSRRRTGVLYGAIAAAVLMALGYLGLERLNRSKPIAPEKASIAVLPLANESGDASQQYFSDGLSEDLITALSQFQGLKVIGRTSSFQFRDSKDDSKTIGAKLGVAHLLEGSVRHAGDMVRVTAELVDTSDGSTQWSERYDRPYKDLFALQDEVTRAVAGAMRAKLVSGEHVAAQSDRPPGGSLEAYNALIQGQFYAVRETEANYRKAIELYTRATELDSGYAPAWSALSRAWARLGTNYLTGAPRQAAFVKAREAAALALQISPELAAAHIAQGFVLEVVDLDWRAAEREYRRALSLAPNDAEAMFLLGGQLATLGDLNRAIELCRQALEKDPRRSVWYKWLALYLSGLHRFDQAAETMSIAAALEPGTNEYSGDVAFIAVLRGDAPAALAAAQQALPGFYQNSALALARQIGGDRTAADEALKALIETNADDGSYEIAQVYALRNETNKVFEWLDRAWSNREFDVGTLLFDPLILRYKDDPRFAAFCRKVGLPVPGESTGS